MLRRHEKNQGIFTMKFSTRLLLGAAFSLAWATGAQAAVVTLDFEGIGDQNPVGNFYAAQGITFSASALALVDSDAGGTGNFGNEPSPNTIMFFPSASDATLNYAAGFDTGFSFFYSSSSAASVSVFDGVDGTGNLLASLNLLAQSGDNNCVGDPSGSYCNWTAIGVSFAGIAKSINFGGAANGTGFDNITFGSSTPGGVPEPTTWAMMLAGFGAVGFAMRRRRNVAVSFA